MNRVYHLMGNPKGPCLHFFHGFMGSHRDWIPVIEPFLKDHMVVLWDLPGHGANDLRKAQFFDVFNKFSPKADFLIGYSMGGRICQMLANQMSYYPKGIFLESSHFGLSQVDQKLKRKHSDMNLFKNIEDQESLRQFLIQWYQSPIWGTLNQSQKFDEMLKSKSIEMLNGWKISLEEFSLGEQENYRNFWQESKIPMTFLSGEDDTKYTEIGKEVKRDEYTHKVIPEAGHNIKFTHLVTFQKELERFIKEYA